MKDKREQVISDKRINHLGKGSQNFEMSEISLQFLEQKASFDSQV